jgi:D-alanine-D-alanine ligase
MNSGITRRRIAVVYGGRSAEHDVSILSATNVVRALDAASYDVVPIYVTRDGKWLQGAFEDLVLATPAIGTELCLVPGGHGRMIAISEGGDIRDAGRIDILFPMLHGLHGEDGSVQGLAEVARVPLMGCGILGSAAALDKDIAKRLLRATNLPVAASVTVGPMARLSFSELADELGLPFFVKPSRQGSSVGVRKVSASQEFASALDEAFGHDSKVLIEQFIDGREVECSILEDPKGDVFVSRPGEIAPAERHGFYSYDAKYVDEGGATLLVPAELPEHVENGIRRAAALAFRALGCDGMARVDFFLKPDMTFVVNEVNTIPGFTDISMYAKAMAASGVSYSELLDRLVNHGLARSGVVVA